MSFTVRLSTAAASKLARMDRPTQGRILRRLHELETNPYDPRVGKPLVQAAGRWSARVGNTWRIIYRIDRAVREVQVEAIQTRGQAYKRL